MTDKEMALELGEYINRLLMRISTLEGVFTEYRITGEDGHRRELPWKEDAKRIAQEPAFLDLSDAQSRGLLQAVGDDIPESQLICSLHRHFVGE
jgi:hypothetical protein